MTLDEVVQLLELCRLGGLTDYGRIRTGNRPWEEIAQERALEAIAYQTALAAIDVTPKAAWEAILQSGSRGIPSAPEMREMLDPAPSWVMAWEEVQNRVQRFGRTRWDEAPAFTDPITNRAVLAMGGRRSFLDANTELMVGLRAQFRDVWNRLAAEQAAVQREQAEIGPGGRLYRLPVGTRAAL